MRTGAGRGGADATLVEMRRPRPSRLTPRTFARALDALAARDADLARLREEWGAPPLRLRPAGFPALLRVIVDQQLSVASARAIWGRLEERVVPMTPEAFLGERSPALRAAGLSRAKIGYARGLAEELRAGRLDLESLDRMDDESAIERLVALKG
ncbi:MAG: DNA-3-methyladenine glycosylase family protein, partial [Alphaproteobacteria bacterium]